MLAFPKETTMKITNTQSGPRGLNTVSGAILVEPGATIETDVYAREKEGLDASGWFKVSGDYTPNPNGQNPAPAGTPTGDLVAKDQEIADLQQKLKAKDQRIAEIEKQLPETDVEKMTVPELRAFLAFHDVAYDGTKDKKDDLLGKAKTVKAA
jgi:hypothetical protein